MKFYIFFRFYYSQAIFFLQLWRVLYCCYRCIIQKFNHFLYITLICMHISHTKECYYVDGQVKRFILELYIHPWNIIERTSVVLKKMKRKKKITEKKISNKNDLNFWSNRQKETDLHNNKQLHNLWILTRFHIRNEIFVWKIAICCACYI